MNTIEMDMATHIVQYIAEQASTKKVSPCSILAEVMKRMLMSCDEDCTHVYWIELKNMLDEKLVRNV